MEPLPIASTAKRPRKLRRAISLFLRVIAVIALLIAASVIERHFVLSAKIKAKLSKIRAAHEPVTLEEEAAYYEHLPLNADGAQLYKQAFTAVRTGGSHRFLKSAIELPMGTNTLPENLRVSMIKAVMDSQAAFEPLQNAAALGPCRFPIDYTNGWAALMTHIADLTSCGRLELCSGVLKSETNVDAAIESIARICKFGDSLNAQPDLIAVLAQFNLDYQAYDLSVWLLNHRILSSAQLTELQKIFSHREPAQWVDRSIIGDRPPTLALFDSTPGDFLAITAPQQITISYALLVRLTRLFGNAKQDELTYLSRVEDVRAVASLPFPESLTEAEDLTRNIRKEARAKALLATGSILPGLIRVIDLKAQHDARMHLIRTALAIEQYRLNYKVLPKELLFLQLSDASILLDPFDGDSLGYNLSEQGYTLYSIGPDREDDGGETSVPLFSKERVPRGDFTATVFHSTDSATR